MKFLQGKKVRDVARKLSVSEADLYRKQKVALESVAQKIAEMELDGADASPAQANETEPSEDKPAESDSTETTPSESTEEA